MTDLQVKCFLEVASCLNFTKAAKNLFISQSNISRQIASFEEEIGLPLFDRNTKGVKLTLQGQMLAETLSEMSSEWELVCSRAKNSIRKFNGCITVSDAPIPVQVMVWNPAWNHAIFLPKIFSNACGTVSTPIFLYNGPIQSIAIGRKTAPAPIAHHMAPAPIPL